MVIAPLPAATSNTVPSPNCAAVVCCAEKIAAGVLDEAALGTNAVGIGAEGGNQRERRRCQPIFEDLYSGTVLIGRARARPLGAFPLPMLRQDAHPRADRSHRMSDMSVHAPRNSRQYRFGAGAACNYACSPKRTSG